jgi:hypothetical protein
MSGRSKSSEFQELLGKLNSSRHAARGFRSIQTLKVGNCLACRHGYDPTAIHTRPASITSARYWTTRPGSSPLRGR